jgi:DNA invertase Pin-like site-specific DNA recombinase
MDKIKKREKKEAVMVVEQKKKAGRPRKKIVVLPYHKPRTVAYLRVSTQEQSVEKNKPDILNLANEKDLGKVEWVEEKVSGKVPWRDRKIKTIIDELQAGDNIIVSELSRLGRSMLDVMEVLSVVKAKDINIYAVKGDWQLNGLQSELIAVVFAMAAQIERELISARTIEGLAKRRASGKKLGRPCGTSKSKLDPFRPEIEALIKNGSTLAFIAERYDSTQGNLHHWLRKRKIDKTRVYTREAV